MKNNWVKIRPYDIRVDRFGVYSITTSTNRKIFTFASNAVQAIENVRNALKNNEKIHTVGIE